MINHFQRETLIRIMEAAGGIILASGIVRAWDPISTFLWLVAKNATWLLKAVGPEAAISIAVGIYLIHKANKWLQENRQAV